LYIYLDSGIFENYRALFETRHNVSGQPRQVESIAATPLGMFLERQRPCIKEAVPSLMNSQHRKTRTMPRNASMKVIMMRDEFL
jgi:hypothetical protein